MKQLIRLEFSEFTDIKNGINYLDKQSILDWSFLSENISGDIDINIFISSYKDKIDFKALSNNQNIKWSKEIIDNYVNELDFQLLSNNIAIPFTEELILRYKNKWSWSGIKNGNSTKFSWYALGGLSFNKRLPLNKYFLKKVVDVLDFRALGMNPSLCIFDKSKYDWESAPCEFEDAINSFEIILNFWDKWNFEGSYWHDDNIVAYGYAKDSIKDNKNIDWKIFELHKLDYKSYFSIYTNKINTPKYGKNDDLPF